MLLSVQMKIISKYSCSSNLVKSPVFFHTAHIAEKQNIISYLWMILVKLSNLNS